MKKRYTGHVDHTGREIYEGDLYEYTLEIDVYDPESGHAPIDRKVKEPIGFIDGEFYHGGSLLADVIEYDHTFKYVGDEE